MTGKRELGFTLVELLVALLILALLAIMAYRSLGTVLDTRDHVREETEKWKSVEAFFVRFQRDVQLASPRPVRQQGSVVLPWVGVANARLGPLLEFSRFAANARVDTPRRVGYGLGENHDIYLLVWPGLDSPPGTRPARYTVLRGVARFELEYMDKKGAWLRAWPGGPGDGPIPRAVRVRLVLGSGEQILRVIAVAS